MNEKDIIKIVRGQIEKYDLLKSLQKEFKANSSMPDLDSNPYGTFEDLLIRNGFVFFRFNPDLQKIFKKHLIYAFVPPYSQLCWITDEDLNQIFSFGFDNMNYQIELTEFLERIK